MRPSETALQALLEEAATKVPIGSRYVHYKHPDHSYVVTGIAIDENTDQPLILYAAEYGARLTFARSLSSWLAPAIVDGKPVTRFQML